MTLTRDRFSEFFAALNDGHPPFAWQERLLDHLIEQGRWPSAVDAPTGAGKSHVVTVHVFAVALGAVGQAPRLPRRLSVVVNRRAIVDQHLERAEALAAALADGVGLVGEVRSALLSLTTSDTPLVAVNLRGGVAPNRQWIDDPTVCAVIAATPDMWGSRVLFRGYGATRRAAPREAGLLAMDSVVVIDEAHLSRQLLETSRRVAGMVTSDAAAVGIPGLSVVATTATPDAVSAGPDVVGVVAGDVAGGPGSGVLARRLLVQKAVQYVESPSWSPRRASKAYIEELADHARAVSESLDPSDQAHQGTTAAPTVLCVVNRVDTAARLAARLRQTCASPHEVQLWVGRMRPMDLERVRRDRPGLFTTDGDHEIRYLVATQTVEVGVDIDCAGLLTELAPGTALAQRLGRVDRLGRRGSASVTVIGPAAGRFADQAPYAESELVAARDWVQQLAELPGGASPWALGQEGTAPPEAALGRAHLSYVRRGDALLLAETSQPLFAEHDLAFWLRDSLDVEQDPVSLVVRDLPPDLASARALIEATLPDAREQFPCSMAEAQGALETVRDAADGSRRRAFRVRDEVVEPLVAEGEVRWDVKAGDVVVVDRGHPLTRAGVIVREGGEVEDLETAWGPDGVSVLRADDPEDRLVIEDLLDDARARQDAAEAGDPAPELRDDREVRFAPDALWEEECPPWAVLLPEQLVADDPECRQEWSPSDGRVELDVHATAVAARAGAMADCLGLPPAMREALVAAGELHDEGKRDVRFQREVLHGDGRVVLAKSGAVSAQSRGRARRASSLPRGWRHEQVSVAHASLAVDGGERDLTLRLVGTSHGHGRSLFPHGPDELLDATSSQELAASSGDLFFAGGEWARVIERTHRRFGVWGCAFLEAVLRSADCMVSKEGS